MRNLFCDWLLIVISTQDMLSRSLNIDFDTILLLFIVVLFLVNFLGLFISLCAAIVEETIVLFFKSFVYHFANFCMILCSLHNIRDIVST